MPRFTIEKWAEYEKLYEFMKPIIEEVGPTRVKYKDFWTDEAVANEMDYRTDYVAAARRRYFGPLREPSWVTQNKLVIKRLTEVEAKLDQIQEELKKCH